MVKRATAALAAALMLGGCSFHQELRQVAVDHNRMVADSADELMLLNIIRSRYRMPMHFSRVTSMSGDISVELAGSAGIDLEQGGSETGSLGADAAVSTNPSFESVPMDDEKFQRGILKPIDTDVIAYLLESGYPDDLIMALFVDRIDLRAIDDGIPNLDAGSFDAEKGFAATVPQPGAAGPFARDELVGRILNDPNRASAFGAFLCTYFLSPSEEESEAEELLRWPQTLGAWPSLFNNGELKDFPYRVERDGNADSGSYVVRGPAGSKSGLAVKRLKVPNERCPASAQSSDPRFEVRFVEDAKGERRLLGLGFPPLASGASAAANVMEIPIGGQTHRLKMELKLRSVVDVLYFLGEYLREERPYEYGRTSMRAGRGLCATAPLGSGQNRVFSVDEGASRPQSLVSVTYRKTRFGISEAALCPSQTGDRSATVLSLMQTMLNLYKANEDLPGSGRVRLIGK